MLKIRNADLPAQKATLQLIIMAVEIRFAVKQRKNAYYRNDPKKYGLELAKVSQLEVLVFQGTFTCGDLKRKSLLEGGYQEFESQRSHLI